jgi:hypothetical protein
MAIEVGLLTCGSSYSPTPSQPSRGQWHALLVFVPAYSGASVRDLHPLPVSFISIARIAMWPREYHLAQHMSSILLPHRDQGTGGEMVIKVLITRLLVPGRAGSIVLGPDGVTTLRIHPTVHNRNVPLGNLISRRGIHSSPPRAHHREEGRYKRMPVCCTAGTCTSREQSVGSVVHR